MPPSDLILPPAPPASGADFWWKLATRSSRCSPCHFARGLQRPWVEEDNWYGAVYSQGAHNNLRAGLHAAGVPATLYFGPLPIPPEAYYVHHPTLLPLLITASFAILGEAEWSARLVLVLASLASVIVLWWMVRGAAGPRAATLAAFVFAAVPMELHYGDMVDFEPLLTFWMLALLLCLQRWVMTASRRWAVAGALFAALALWTDWPGYLLVLSVAASVIFGAARQRRWLGWLLGALVGVAGMLFLIQIRWANTAAWTDLWSALQMRLGNAIPTSTGPIAADAQRFTWADWTSTVLDDLRANYLVMTWLLVAVGIWWVLRRAGARMPGFAGWAGRRRSSSSPTPFTWCSCATNRSSTISRRSTSSRHRHAWRSRARSHLLRRRQTCRLPPRLSLPQRGRRASSSLAAGRARFPSFGNALALSSFSTECPA